MDFYRAIAKRRSVYATTKESPVSEEKIEKLIKSIIDVAPSSFNSQSTRVVVLFGKKHEAFWKLVLKKLKEVTPKEQMEETKAKVNMLAESFGTILFYEDQNIVANLQEAFPIYAENFPIWAEHSSAMLQYAIWTALEIEGMGATLQHYNPLIDEETAKKYKIPGSWKLICQMPFGGIAEKPGKAEHIPVEEKIIVKK